VRVRTLEKKKKRGRRRKGKEEDRGGKRNRMARKRGKWNGIRKSSSQQGHES
jgi:hypothetical protein